MRATGSSHAEGLAYVPLACCDLPFCFVCSADVKACTALAEKVVNDTSGCNLPPCTLEIPPAWANLDFEALSGFHVVYHFYGLGPEAGLDELQKVSVGLFA